MPHVILVTGGARSGKSTYALKHASAYGKGAFIATAAAIDDEMKDRIEKHKKQRGDSFVTVEEPTDLAGALGALPADTDVAVIDCLTLWLGNLAQAAGPDIEALPEVKAFLEAITDPPCDLLIVTNEVGMGIVPDNPLARKFRDSAGFVNQNVAKIADVVVFMVSGQPIFAKGELE